MRGPPPGVGNTAANTDRVLYAIRWIVHAPPRKERRGVVEKVARHNTAYVRTYVRTYAPRAAVFGLSRRAGALGMYVGEYAGVERRAGSPQHLGRRTALGGSSAHLPAPCLAVRGRPDPEGESGRPPRKSNDRHAPPQVPRYYGENRPVPNKVLTEPASRRRARRRPSTGAMCYRQPCIP